MPPDAPTDATETEPLDTVALRLALTAPAGSRLRGDLAHAASAFCGDHVPPAEDFDRHALRALYDRAYTERATVYGVSALQRALERAEA